MLVVNNLKAGYSEMPVIHDVNFDVQEGEIVALLGSNGSGKTTSLRCVTGAIPIMGGEILYKGKDLTKVSSHKIVTEGITMVPEGRRLFPKMSTYDNLMMGAYTIKDAELIEERLNLTYDLFPILKERGTQLTGTMSGGEQQMVAIGRALMSTPELLILDEPSLGIMPKLVDQIFEFVVQINKLGVTILIVEQNVDKTLEFVDSAFILTEGETVLSGTREELQNDDRVRKVYLGM
ncbi:MAG: ABC transporter ATP-binding protein [Clostridiales bacterium]|nr:ABC transporter ATP-binding protein [Clostridiales bacterium]